MRKSKFVGMQSGTWTCVGSGVAFVQSAFKQKKDENGKRVRSKSPGHRQYYYIFDRITSDKKAMKSIVLSAAQTRQVYTSKRTVEYFAEKKEAKRSLAIKDRINYCFCD